jgi:hypothetical protein
MSDSVQTNWNVVWIVYGTRNPTTKMVDKKWMYFLLDLVFWETY